jgi:hypothetical protein
MLVIVDIVIKEVKSKKDLRKFVAFPYNLYKGNKYWILLNSAMLSYGLLTKMKRSWEELPVLLIIDS